MSVCLTFVLAFDLYSRTAICLRDEDFTMLRLNSKRKHTETEHLVTLPLSLSLYLLLALCPPSHRVLKQWHLRECESEKANASERERERWDRGSILDHVYDPAACLLHNGHSNRWPCTYTQTHPHTHRAAVSLPPTPLPFQEAPVSKPPW